ncbi:MAG TPA: hydrogenase 4 subunit F [Symbiobacteriaceae bacterium]|jgi:hydrogenase-4 component F
MKLATWIGGLWSALLLVVSLVLGRSVYLNGPWHGFYGMVYVDLLAVLMLGLISFVALTAALYSAGYIRHEVEKGQLTEWQVLGYYVLFHLFVLIMIAAVVVENLGFLWITIEATTLVSAVLVGFYNRKTSLEAAWKYVILCGAGIAFALLGLILLYSAAVRAGMDPATALNWTDLAASAKKLDPAAVRMAFALVLLGFGTKAGLAPMHSWMPDAYSQAPTPVAILSGALTNTALYAVLRFHVISVRVLGPAFSGNILLVFGLISLGMSVLFILVQKDFKRLLAYSSVEHMGLICVGIGLGGPVGLFGAVLHMVGHTMGKALLFMTAGNIGHRYHTYRMERVQGALRALPFTGPLMVIGAMAITGMPPTALFLSEFSIVAAGFNTGRIWVSAVVLLGIALAFAGMALHLREMILGDVPHGIHTGERFSWGSVPLLLPLIAVVILGIWIPAPFAAVLRQVAGLLGGGV